MWWNSGRWWTHYQGGINEMENNERMEEFNVKAEAALKDMEERVAANVKKYRAKRGLTQQQLGDMIGRSKHSISRLESGNAFPKGETLSKLCASLDVNICQLFAKDNCCETFPDFIKFLSDDQKNKLKEIAEFINKNLE